MGLCHNIAVVRSVVFVCCRGWERERTDVLVVNKLHFIHFSASAGVIHIDLAAANVSRASNR